MRPFRSPDRVSALRVVVALACCLLLAGAARAQEPPADPDEVTGLRVTRPATGGVALTWDAPVTAPDTYQVRRCLLASLRAAPPYYGNCVAEGLVATGYSETPPAGDVFYLVSATFAGAEGSLGRAFDGRTWTDRSAPACSSPVLPAPMSVSVRLDIDEMVCGTNVTLRYLPAAASFVQAACTGVTAAFFGATNPAAGPDLVRHACVSATGARAPGLITQFDFQRGDCPLTLDAFAIVECAITIGQPDCGNPITVVQPCTLE